MNSLTKKSIGVTGNIGSGKSEVCRIFAALGAEWISTDALAKEFEENDSAVKRRIVAQFGEEMYTPEGKLNKKVVGKLIFSDDSAKEKLNAIVHPVVIEAIRKRIELFKKQSASAPFILVESALIYEAGMLEMFDYVIFVDAPVEAATERVMKRDNIGRSDVVDRQKSQWPADKKIDDADFVIRNTGDMKSLEAHCKFIYTILLSLAKNP